MYGIIGYRIDLNSKGNYAIEKRIIHNSEK
jgi:hypothetical protein